MQIKFGTDGWRDIIADNYTVANVAAVAKAHAQFLQKNGGKSVVIGFDTRFGSQMFAQTAAKVMAASGLKTYLAKAYLPTPALSFAVKNFGADGGVMITASHNPPQYNGYKIKGSYGGSATPAMVTQIEHELTELGPIEFDDSFEIFDIRESYFTDLARQLDLDLLKSYKGVFYHDSMGGAGSGWLEAFVKKMDLALEFRAVHGLANPMFYGVNPEPIPQNLTSLIAVLSAETGKTFAAVTDGDADRVGAVLAGGIYFNSHQIFAVLLDALYQKGFRGRVVKTVSGSRIIDALAKKRGLEIVETPVAFKYMTESFLEGQKDPNKAVLIGGEESGGLAVAGHIPERDGLLNSLLLLEAVARKNKSLAEIFADIEEEVGLKHAFDRLDVVLPKDFDTKKFLDNLRNADKIGDQTVQKRSELDGLKLFFADSWLLFRLSGTEPLLRIYCEASDQQIVQSILKNIQKMIK